MKKCKNTKTLDQFIEAEYGKRGTPKREKFENGYHDFQSEAEQDLKHLRKKKLKSAFALDIHFIRDESLNELSEIDLFPEKTKKANEILSKLRWNI